MQELIECNIPEGGEIEEIEDILESVRLQQAQVHIGSEPADLSIDQILESQRRRYIHGPAPSRHYNRFRKK